MHARFGAGGADHGALYAPYRDASPSLLRLHARYPFVNKAFFNFFKKLEPNQFEVHLRESSMDR